MHVIPGKNGLGDSWPNVVIVCAEEGRGEDGERGLEEVREEKQEDVFSFFFSFACLCVSVVLCFIYMILYGSGKTKQKHSPPHHNINYKYANKKYI